MTAYTRRRVIYDLTKPLDSQDAEALRNWFANVKPRNIVTQARGLAERTLDAIKGGNSTPDDFKPYAGMGWYSREILKRCDWLEKAKHRGDDCDRIAELGFEIGMLITEARLKSAWDQDVELAIATEEGRKRGGGHNRKHSVELYVSRYLEFREFGLNKTDATIEAAKVLEVSPATIRNARKEAGASG